MTLQNLEDKRVSGIYVFSRILSRMLGTATWTANEAFQYYAEDVFNQEILLAELEFRSILAAHPHLVRLPD